MKLGLYHPQIEDVRNNQDFPQKPNNPAERGETSVGTEASGQ